MKLLPRDWYSVSVSALRRWLTLAIALAVLGIAYFGYRQWEKHDLRRRAEQTVEQAQRLIEQLEERPDFATIRSENAPAWERLDEAKSALAARRYRPAYELGRSCVSILRTLVGTDGKIRILRVHGAVEYRRGARGAWRRAQGQLTLTAGDWVKTSADGTAEIRFPDGTLYVLREDTMVHLGGFRASVDDEREERSTNLAFGWVELDTNQRGSTVSTPDAEAQVRRNSSALVTYDRDQGTGRFAAYQGSLEIRTDDGEAQEVGTLQEIEVRSGEIGGLQTLPAPPQLVQPNDDDTFDLDRQRRIALAWRPVSRGVRYVLQVASNRQFASPIIDDLRSRTRATIALQGEGDFFWKVAAINREQRQGPWSNPRRFRVAALGAVAGNKLEDTEPPKIEIQEILAYGALVIVKGRTEPGASVTINGESVSPALDGSFNKTIQMTREGWTSIEIVATDIAGNASRARDRVLIEEF